MTECLEILGEHEERAGSADHGVAVVVLKSDLKHTEIGTIIDDRKSIDRHAFGNKAVTLRFGWRTIVVLPITGHIDHTADAAERTVGEDLSRESQRAGNTCPPDAFPWAFAQPVGPGRRVLGSRDPGPGN